VLRPGACAPRAPPRGPADNRPACALRAPRRGPRRAPRRRRGLRPTDRPGGLAGWLDGRTARSDTGTRVWTRSERSRSEDRRVDNAKSALSPLLSTRSRLTEEPLSDSASHRLNAPASPRCKRLSFLACCALTGLAIRSNRPTLTDATPSAADGGRGGIRDPPSAIDNRSGRASRAQQGLRTTGRGGRHKEEPKTPAGSATGRRLGRSGQRR